MTANLCFICSKTDEKQDKALINICNCEKPAHVSCLTEYYKHTKLDSCEKCLSKYKINEPIYRTKSGVIIKQVLDENIFFPHHDWYYQPLMSKSSLFKAEGMNRLTMAIMYLQVERVKELLKEPEIVDRLSTYYFGYEGYKQTPLIALSTGNLPSNCHISFDNNHDKYYQIFSMLLDTEKIYVWAIDAFGKSVSNYLNQNKMIQFKTLLWEKTAPRKEVLLYKMIEDVRSRYG